MSRRAKALILFCVLSCALCALTLIPAQLYKAALPHQQAAERWSGKQGGYAQVTLFLSDNAALTQDDIPALREKVDASLAVASLEAGDGARLWYDAYSAELDMDLERGFLKASATAVGVGGDFFLIHNMRLISGAYISESDISRDQAVLDRHTAWQLFGSSDCVGMDFMIGQRIYYVAGVVDRDEGAANELTMGDKGRVYLHLNQLGQNTPINCYEAVMPDVVSDFALKTLEDAAAATEGEYAAVQNTGRFSLVNLFKALKGLTERSVRTDKIAFPYWENAARLTLDRLALLLVLRILLGAFPAVCLIVWIIKRYKNRKWRLKHLFEKAESVLEARREAKYEMNAVARARSAAIAAGEAESAGLPPPDADNDPAEEWPEREDIKESEEIV